MKTLVFPLILLFLAIPYLLLTRFLPGWAWPESEEFLWALRNSLTQASGSAIFALVMGALLVPGLLALTGKARAWTSWVLLSPSFFPPLFLLLSALSFLDPFPMGNLGIVLIQGFMNAGLLAVLFARDLETKWAGLIEMSEVAGASKSLFLRAAFRGMLPDFLSLGLFVFAMSFASFSIPLVIGAGKATNLEILIYEKIRISNEWGVAISLSFLQLALIGSFALLPRARDTQAPGRSEALILWGSRLGLIPIALYALIFWGPLLKSLPGGIAAFLAMPGLAESAALQSLVTFLIALATGLVCLALLIVSAFGGSANGVPRLLRGWIAPSTALIGFAFLFRTGDAGIFAYVVALALIFFPAVARLGWDRALEALRSQHEVARTLGASEFLIWRSVLVPQMWRLSCVLAGIAGVWAIGEFALGKIILGRPATWSLLSESLMSSYRIEASIGLSGMILLGGACVFLFFWGLGHVRR